MSGLVEYSPKQLSIIKANNPLLEPVEIDTLVEYSKRANLDLFRRQLSAIVFGAKAKDKSKRRVAFVIGIDGYRAMADRTGCYAPHEDPVLFEVDKDAIDERTNPKGIIRATIKVKKFAQGTWHTYSASADWDEFAPVEQEWIEGEDGRRKPSGKMKLADNWRKMPRVMLGKVAEAQALRRGWPDTLAGLYVEEEMDREKYLDLTASEIIEQTEQEERQRKIGGANAIMFDWCKGGPLERVADGHFADRILAWLREDLTTTEIKVLKDRNREGFREFWARHPGDALKLKQAMEEREDELVAREAA